MRGKWDLSRICGENPNPVLGEEENKGKLDLFRDCGRNPDPNWERRNMKENGIQPKFVAGIVTNVGRGGK